MGLFSFQAMAESPATLKSVGLTDDMIAAVKKDMPKFELWQFSDFAPWVQKNAEKTQYTPTPAVAVGDMDGDGKKDAILFGKGEQTIFDKVTKVHQYIVVSFSKKKNAYQATNYYAYDAPMDSKQVCKTIGEKRICGLLNFMEAYTKEELLKAYNPKNCTAPKDDIRDVNPIFFFNDGKTRVVSLKNNYPHTLCGFFWSVQ